MFSFFVVTFDKISKASCKNLIFQSVFHKKKLMYDSYQQGNIVLCCLPNVSVCCIKVWTHSLQYEITQFKKYNTTLFHYTPKNHRLEVLNEFQTKLWGSLPKGSFLIALSSVAWREVWKYGERAFRYTHLDAGHAWHPIVISAQMLGWHTTRVETLSDENLDHLLGFTQKERYFEDEQQHMFFLLSQSTIK